MSSASLTDPDRGALASQRKKLSARGGRSVGNGPVLSAAAIVSLAVLLVGVGAGGGLEPAQGASVGSVVYDVVIHGGRVMDPESGLDAVGSIGISAGVIRSISAQPLTGRVAIDAAGLVVAPGFIDVVWNMPREYAKVQLLDGVTNAVLPAGRWESRSPT